MGVIGLLFTPRQEDPEISVPMVDIFIQYPCVSAQQVAALAIDPLERMMSEIPSVKYVYSASIREEGMVTVRFKVGEEMGPQRRQDPVQHLTESLSTIGEALYLKTVI